MFSTQYISRCVTFNWNSLKLHVVVAKWKYMPKLSASERVRKQPQQRCVFEFVNWILRVIHKTINPQRSITEQIPNMYHGGDTGFSQHGTYEISQICLDFWILHHASGSIRNPRRGSSRLSRKSSKPQDKIVQTASKPSPQPPSESHSDRLME